MTIIKIEDLRPVGYDLFADEESYMRELSSDEELSVEGGGSTLVSWALTVSSGACAFSVTLVAITGLTVAVTVEL